MSACPVCQKDDQVQKITAIVKSGVVTGSFSGPSVGAGRAKGEWVTSVGSTSLHGTTKTELARQLEPPPSPSEPHGLGCWGWIGVLFGLYVAAIMLFTLGLMISSVETVESTSSIWVLVGRAFAFGGPVVFVVGIVLAWQRHKRLKEQQTVEYLPALEAWRRAMKKYERLYYCGRDDVVFDPDDGTSASLSTFEAFLYS